MMAAPPEIPETPEIVLEGGPFERGLAHGRALGEPIRAFLADGRARVQAIRHTPLPEAEIDRRLAAHGRVVERHLPALAEELCGLARGAGISYQDALLLQYRRELVAAGNAAGLEGDCSTVAWRRAPAGPIAAQTVDLEGGMADLGIVLRIRLPGDGPEILLYSFAGLLGYMGVSSRGFALLINFVLAEGWRPGISPYLLARHLLEQPDVETALAALYALPRASSRCFTLVSAGRLVAAELTAANLCLLEGDFLAHTNHYLHPDLEPEDRLHFLFRNSSRQRLALLTSWAGTHAPEPEALMGLLADHSLFPVGICAHAQGDLRRSDTVAAVVAEPAAGRLHVRRGHPCETASRVFSLSETCVAAAPGRHAAGGSER